MVTGLGIISLFFCVVAQSKRSWSYSIGAGSTRRTAVEIRGSFLQPIAGHGIYNGDGQHSNSLCLLYATATSTDGEQVGPPTYLGDEKAVDYFSNPYFYKNQRHANFFAEDREEVFGVMLMRAVIQQWKTEQQQKNLAESIGASQGDVILALAPEVEDRLNRDGIVSINGHAEIETLEKYHVPGVPTAEDAASSVTHDAVDNRPDPIYLITGPSGSGKTFVAVKEVSTYEVDHPKKVTLYVQPNSISQYNMAAKSRKNGILMKFIKESLTDRFGYDPNQTLNMHVTLVLDEIQRGDHFDDENKTLLTFFSKHVKKFAVSVRLVACGTGLTGANLVSNIDCYKIHLSTWNSTDVAVVLAERLKSKKISQKSILNAIANQPILNALTSNARAAGFLLEEIATYTIRLPREYMKQGTISNRLNDAAPFLFDTVVSRYTEMKGLQRLNSGARRRVAAFVLGAVEDASNRTRLEPPDLEGLNIEEEAVAWSLIEHNVEYSTFSKVARLVRKDERPILVSPAITVVLFSMLSTPARIFTGWKAQERISALYALRQAVLTSLDCFRTNRENGLEGLDHDLAKLELVRLREGVPPGGKPEPFFIPRSAKNTIWINGDNAAFADVIAPCKLIQCKHTSIDVKKLRVDLYNELGKCGLLRNYDKLDDKNEMGRVAMRAIWFMWSDEYENNHNLDLDYSGKKEEARYVSAVEQQKSLAFPESVLASPSTGDDYESVTVLLENGNWWIRDGTKHVKVPELSCLSKPGKPRVSFIISTNAPRIAVVANQTTTKTTCEICQDYLHDDGRVNIVLLEKQGEKDAWEKLEATIVDGVDIKFLFT